MKRRNKVKIVTRKLGRERAYGLQEPGLLQIDSRLTGKRRLTILIHESLHEVFPGMSEYQVTRTAPKLASILWQDRWRQVTKL